MSKGTKMRLAIIALLLASMPSVAVGQTKTGTSIAQFLLIEPSARFAAMGNAGVSFSDGIQAGYYNPGALGTLDRFSIQFTHSDWFAGITYDYVAGVLPLSYWGNFFASITALNSGDIEVRTVDNPHGTGELYSVSDVALGLGFARRVTKKFAAGIQINYVSETIWHTTMETVTLNVGTVYRISESGFQIGSSIAHYGAKGQFSGRDLAIQYDNDPDRYGDNSALPGEQRTGEFPVPVLFRIGMNYPLRVSESSLVTLAVDAFHPSDNTESVSTGLEWTWKESVSLRAGYQNLFQEDSEVGLALGAGLEGALEERRFGFDYAWADHGRLDRTHRLTFVVEL